MFTKLLRKNWRCRNIELASIRQEIVPGWNQVKMKEARWLFVGAGGNGYVAEGAAKKGMGEIHLCDKDVVVTSNLSRQKFTSRDLSRSKATCLARNLSRIGCLGSRLVAHVAWFQELNLDSIVPQGIVCAVDPSIPGTRREVAKVGLVRSIPVIFWAVSSDASWGWVFVQEPGGACLACLLPEDKLHDKDVEANCPATPATCDALLAVGSFALYAMDTLVMERPRDWNFRSLSLSRSDFGQGIRIMRKAGCHLCSKATS